MALENDKWYAIDPYSKVEYMRKGDVEHFRHQPSGFMAAWNGSTETKMGVLTGTGLMIREAQRDSLLSASPLLPYELTRMPENSPFPKIDEGDFFDGKHYTPGTGGSERAYVAKELRVAVLHPDKNVSAYAREALISWNKDNMHRPFSQAPNWTYGKDDHWKDSGRSSSTRVGKNWNRVDAAHASRPQSCALAALGHPLGVMMAWMEYRALQQDQQHTKQYWMNQPRSVAWLWFWATRAHLLGFGEAAPELLEEFFSGLTPKQWLKEMAAQVIREWPDRYPWAGKPGETSTKEKVFPKCLDETSPYYGEVKGRYSWQTGFLLAAIAYLLDSGMLKSKANRDKIREFGLYLCKDLDRAYVSGRGWAYSYGLTEWDNALEAQAVIRVVRDDYHQRHGKYPTAMEANQLGDDIWNVIKSPKWDYAIYPIFGYANLRGLEDPVVVDALEKFSPGYEPQYLDPFWRMMEDSYV